MPISSYVVRYDPRRAAEVARRLEALEGIRVGEAVPDGVPVAADTRTADEAQAMGDLLATLPGVLSATLVYHNFEDLDEAL